MTGWMGVAELGRGIEQGRWYGRRRDQFGTERWYSVVKELDELEVITLFVEDARPARRSTGTFSGSRLSMRTPIRRSSSSATS